MLCEVIKISSTIKDQFSLGLLLRTLCKELIIAAEYRYKERQEGIKQTILFQHSSSHCNLLGITISYFPSSPLLQCTHKEINRIHTLKCLTSLVPCTRKHRNGASNTRHIHSHFLLQLVINTQHHSHCRHRLTDTSHRTSWNGVLRIQVNNRITLIVPHCSIVYINIDTLIIRGDQHPYCFHR